MIAVRPRLARVASLVSLMLSLIASEARSDTLLLQRVFSREPGEVRLDVTLLDDAGFPVLNRPAADFLVLADAVEFRDPKMYCEPFARSTESASVVVLVPTHASMQPALAELQKGLTALAAHAINSYGSRLGLLGYAGVITQLLRNADQRPQIRAAIAQLKTDGQLGAQVLTDAIREGINLLRGQPRDSRKLLVVISDGMDAGARKELGALGDSAAQAGIVVSAITYGAAERDKAFDLLIKRSFGSRRLVGTPTALGQAVQTLGDEIAKQYECRIAIPKLNLAEEHTYQIKYASPKGPIFSNTLSARAPVVH